ncbi:hypothetical protein BC629DRAFT_1594610 [Irpex lacteus]|nr:hypothetical protein BC629DRAFT_1594610 [Irpex lacteus]
MADQFYFITSPHPTDYPNGLTNAAGQQLFFIKFGDGLGQTRYDTHNPSYQLAQNNHNAGSGTYGPPGSTTPGVRIGKFVETYLLAANGLNLTRVGQTEWYIIRPGPAGIATLRTWLANLLTAFPGANFDGTGAQTADQVAWAWIQQTLASARNNGFH